MINKKLNFKIGVFVGFRNIYKSLITHQLDNN